MPEPFKMYRIICTITDRALVSGSDHPNWGRNGSPPQWYMRGSWAKSTGAFWKGEWTVKQHLQNLCHDWRSMHRPMSRPRYPGELYHWREPIPGFVDWSRLEHLRVDQFLVTDYSVTKWAASDFIGMVDQKVA